MQSRYKDIYIGHIIQAKVDEKGMSYADFARSIHCARTSLYHLFESKSIDVERLLLISEVLEYDFISEVYGHHVASVPLPPADCVDYPYLHLPIKENHIDLSHLPPHILAWLREQLAEE